MATSILKLAFSPLYNAIMGLYRLIPLSYDTPSIRLLELELESNEASDLYLKMDTYKIQLRPEYDALSYAWGANSDLVNIDVNGHEHPVTPNLHDALRQCRHNQSRNRETKRKLWIDAICIDQADNAEKSSQLMLMKDIFAGARNVLVWLGKADRLTELAFDTLERFSADDGTADGIATYEDISILGKVDERRVAIQLFLKRPYFDRVWIIQEVVVAKTAIVLCGPFSTTFDKLYAACQRMTGSGFLQYSTSSIGKLTYLGDWKRYYQELGGDNGEEAFDLKVFIDSRDKSATNLRDKVYALRGLLNSAIREGIVVNYDDTVEKVYMDLAKHLLTAQPGLRVLSAVVLQHRKSSVLKLPSWAPDWSQRQWGGGILQKYYRFAPSKYFKAGGTGNCCRVTKSEDSETICLEGYRLDTVKRAISVKEHRNITEHKVREMAKETMLQEIYSFTGESLWKAFFHTLTADRSALSSRVSEDYRSKYFSAFRHWNPNLSPNERLENLPPTAWAEISRTLGAIVEDKVIFVTERGYLGLGQEGVRAGDMICILAGGETPFVLRNSPDHEGRLHFLSECYVHGVMDGEVLNDQGRIQLEEFLLH